MKLKPIILITILLVPSVLYLMLTTGRHNIQSLQYFGPKAVDEKQVNGKTVIDSIYHTVEPFQLLNSDSQLFDSKIQLKDKIYIANFFFTNCPTICKQSQALLKTVQNRFENFEDIDILSITVDPDNDTPQKLKEFSTLVGAKKGQWFFLTGNKDYIYNLALKSYLVNVSEDAKADGGILHSDLMLLVDRKGRIRGMFEGSSAKDVKRLIDETKVLVAEYNLSKRSNKIKIK